MEDKKDGLLDRLSGAAGCTCLSDLKKGGSGPYFLRVKDIKRMKEYGYSLMEWTEAVNYIIGGRLRFQCVEEAVDYLVRVLPCCADDGCDSI